MDLFVNLPENIPTIKTLRESEKPGSGDLKIFLGDKRIILAEKKQVPSLKADWIIEYRSAAQVKDLYLEFSGDPGAKGLVIWSEKNVFPELAQGFISLFRYIEAAGGIVLNEKDEVLFIFRRGRWDLPKGKLNQRRTLKKKGGKAAETPEEAALREVKEETGIRELEMRKSAGSTFHIYPLKKELALKRTHWFEMHADSKEMLVPEEKEDITLATWVRRRDLGKILENTYPSLAELIAGYLVPGR